MADNIRQFRSREEQIKKEREKNRKNKLIILAFIAVALIVIIYFIMDYQKKEYTDYSITDWSEIEGTGNSEVVPFDEYLLCYNRDGASCIDYKNQRIWNQPFEMQSPIIDKKEQVAAIADKGGNRIYLFDKDGELGEIETLLPIRKIAVSNQGTVAVLLKDADVNRIHYYNKNGELISEMKIGMDNMGYPIAMDLSEDGSLFAVSFISIQQGRTDTIVSFYNFGTVGQEYNDRLVKSKTYEDSIYPIIKFINKETAVAFGDHGYRLFEGTQIPEEKEGKQFEDEIRSVFYDDENLGFVFRSDETDANYLIELYGLNGNLQFSEKTSFPYTKIKLDKDKIVLFHDTAFCVYTMNGVKKYEGAYEATIKNVISTNKQSRYLVVTPTELDRIKLE